MTDHTKHLICIHEEIVHRQNMETLEKQYENVFELVSSYEELVELNRWAEISKKNELKRFANTLKEFLSEKE